MATSNSQRVAAFLLALLFLLTTVGTTAYVIWQINQDDTGIVPTPTESTQADSENTQQQEESDNTAQQQETETASTTLENFTGPVDIPVLRFDDTVVGTGDVVVEGATVTIHYTGALASDGTVFDSSVGGEPAEFPLASLIQGWQEGIPGMKIGGTRRLYIPSDKAYGPGERDGIPANSDLIFDIELFATK